MELKLKRKTVFLFILFFLADRCLWLVDIDVQRKAFEICCYSFILLFIIFVAKKSYKRMLSIERYNYTRLVLFVFVMAIYSTIQAMVLHGQSFFQGFYPQRFMLASFLLYYVITQYLNEKKGSLESLKSMFLLLGYCELVLYILQYLLINSVQFLQKEETIRLGEIRMNMAAVAIPFVVFNSISNMFSKKRIMIKDILLVIAGFFYSFVVAQTRILLVAYVIALIVGFLSWKGTGKKKIIMLFVLVAVVLVLVQTKLFDYTMEGINMKDSSSKTRELGREYYLTKIVEHPFLGSGYINTGNENALKYSGMNSIENGIIGWTDLGVYGLTFFFGIIGLIWFIILYGKMTYQAFKIAKMGNVTYLMFMVYSIVSSPNITNFLWYIGNTVSFVLWICLIEKEYKNSYPIKNHIAKKKLTRLIIKANDLKEN